MPIRKSSFIIPTLLGAVIVVAGLALFWPASEASAQCGSQASSCKNCHEVQGKDPVNNDGTGWHQSHAFGDFCYLCHAGNNQSMNADEAHTGMVPPLSDVNAACLSCHPGDLADRAQVYASALGVEVGSGSSGPASGPAPSGETGTTSTSNTTSVEPAAPSMVVGSEEDVIDYNLQYEQTVLGKRTINWGNLIVSVMIVFLAVGGGAYVYWNERKLRGIKPAKVAGRQKAATGSPIRLEDFSPEVLSLLPEIAQLPPSGLHALRRLLENPEQASELLLSLSRLDPELVRRIRSMDRDSRALLLAMAGD